MRDLRKHTPWLLVLLGVLAARPATRVVSRAPLSPPPPPLLVAVAPAGGATLVLHPVAVMTDSGLVDPRVGEEGDSSSARFAATYFQPGQRYQLAAAGRFVGTAHVDSTASAGCVGIDGVATASALSGFPLDSARLATTAPPSWSDALAARPLSAREQATMQGLLVDTLRALGTAPDLVRAATFSGAVYGAARADTLVLLAVLNTPDTAAAGIVVSALVIAELTGSRVTPVLVQVPDSLEFAIHARALIDAFDIDRDGWPELMVRDSYSEGSNYTVFRRHGGRWNTWYHGGGGGC